MILLDYGGAGRRGSRIFPPGRSAISSSTGVCRARNRPPPAGRAARPHGAPAAAFTDRVCLLEDIFGARALRDSGVFDASEPTAVASALPWSALAARAGYAEQPHMAREFRALLGMARSAWRRLGADSFKTPSRGIR